MFCLSVNKIHAACLVDVSNHSLDTTGFLALIAWISLTLLLEHVGFVSAIVLEFTKSVPILSGSPNGTTEEVLAMIVPERFVRVWREEVNLQQHVANLAFEAIKRWPPKDDDFVLLKYTDHLHWVIIKAACTKATGPTLMQEV